MSLKSQQKMQTIQLEKGPKQEQTFHERGSAMVGELRRGCSAIVSHQAKANPNHSEIPRHLANAQNKKVKTRASEDPEKCKKFCNS